MKDLLLSIAIIILLLGVSMLDSQSIIGYVITAVGLVLLGVGAWISGAFYEYKDED